MLIYKAILLGYVNRVHVTVNSSGQALIKPFVIYKHLCWDSIQVLTLALGQPSIFFVHFLSGQLS